MIVHSQTFGEMLNANIATEDVIDGEIVRTFTLTNERVYCYDHLSFEPQSDGNQQMIDHMPVTYKMQKYINEKAEELGVSRMGLLIHVFTHGARHINERGLEELDYS